MIFCALPAPIEKLSRLSFHLNITAYYYHRLNYLLLIFLCIYFVVYVWKQEGATLMHYAVQTASIETIELLLLYNVDINLQDNVWLIVPIFSIFTLVIFCGAFWEHIFILSVSGWLDTITSCCSNSETKFSEASAA